jgi:hypothetical protein
MKRLSSGTQQSVERLCSGTPQTWPACQRRARERQISGAWIVRAERETPVLGHVLGHPTKRETPVLGHPRACPQRETPVLGISAFGAEHETPVLGILDVFEPRHETPVLGILDVFEPSRKRLSSALFGSQNRISGPMQLKTKNQRDSAQRSEARDGVYAEERLELVDRQS